jgi:hypothetical protein
MSKHFHTEFDSKYTLMRLKLLVELSLLIAIDILMIKFDFIQNFVLIFNIHSEMLNTYNVDENYLILSHKRSNLHRTLFFQHYT